MRSRLSFFQRLLNFGHVSSLVWHMGDTSLCLDSRRGFPRPGAIARPWLDLQSSHSAIPAHSRPPAHCSAFSCLPGHGPPLRGQTAALGETRGAQHFAFPSSAAAPPEHFTNALCADTLMMSPLSMTHRRTQHLGRPFYPIRTCKLCHAWHGLREHLPRGWQLLG